MNEFQSYEDIKKKLENYRARHNYGYSPFNNRPYDFFHVFSVNYNIHNIVKATEQIVDEYIWKPECWDCSYDQLPNSMACAGTSKCMFRLHWRGSSKEKEKSPLIECKSTPNNPLTIGLSRANLSFLYYYKLDFVLRATRINGWIFHHSTGGKFDDRPGFIKLVKSGWHTSRHSQIDRCCERICILTSFIEIATNPMEVRILETKIELEERLLMNLKNIDNDPWIMRLVWEINERVKLGYL